jgi:hypothetical protein
MSIMNFHNMELGIARTYKIMVNNHIGLSFSTVSHVSQVSIMTFDE